MTQSNATRQETEQDVRWRAVLARDANCDGRFVFAVRTTGIYCKPSCPARKPARHNVAFFADPAGAEAAGYRPCKRCHPQREASPALETVRAVCRHIEAHLDEPLTLAQLGALAGWSPHHLQRVFKRAVGVTPKQYADARRLELFKQTVRRDGDVTRALFAAGYGSSSRLYERSDARLGMTPATYGKRGKNMNIRYAVVEAPLGRLLVAATPRGICKVSLGDDGDALAADLRAHYPAAEIAEDPGPLADWVAAVVAYLAGERRALDLPLDVLATAFQWQVWRALQKIPYGQTRSYREVAEAVGRPRAVRAVAGACARNPVALVTPCHRVVRADGGLGGYRWGAERKRALLEREGALRKREGALLQRED